MFRGLRSLLALRRLPVHAEAHLSKYGAQHAYDVRHVKVVRRTPLRKKLLWRGAQVFTFYCLWRIVSSRIVIEYDDDEEEEEVDQNKGDVVRKEGQETSNDDEEDVDEEFEDDEEDDDSIFIPLGFAQPVPREPYRGDDPEFKEFVQFSRDVERKEHVMAAVRDMMYGLCNRDERFAKVLGLPLRLGRSWLDIEYPLFPPPEYERRGIEITPSYIAYTHQPVDAKTYHKLRHSFWPSAMVWSTWESVRTTFNSWGNQVRGVNASTPAWHPFFRPPTPPIDQPPPMNTNSKEGEDPAQNIPYPIWVMDKDSKQLSFLQLHGELSKRIIDDASVRAFQSSFRKTYKPAFVPPSRGTLIITGTVEVAGTQGAIIFDVSAAFHPKTNKFEVLSFGRRRTYFYRQYPAR